MTEILNRFSLLPQDMMILILKDYVGLVQPKWIPTFDRSGRAILKVNISKGIFANIEQVLRQKKENPPLCEIHCMNNGKKESCYTALTFTVYENVYIKRTYSVLSYDNFYTEYSHVEKYCEIQYMKLSTREYWTYGTLHDATYRYQESMKIVCEYPRVSKKYDLSSFEKQNLFLSYVIKETNEDRDMDDLMIYL